MLRYVGPLDDYKQRIDFTSNKMLSFYLSSQEN
jgi:hypothetical protein